MLAFASPAKSGSPKAIGFNVETVEVILRAIMHSSSAEDFRSTKTSNSKCGTWEASLAYGTWLAT